MTLEGYKEEFLDYLNKKVVLKQPKNLYEPIIYILGIGGKRLRPVLTLMICDLFGGDAKKAFDAALAVEVFHNFTLVHDDIMDSAPIRRGQETVHKKWDENTGILSGDAMMIIAYQCFESYDVHLYKKLLKVFNRTALEVCEGQQLDVDFESRNDVSIDEYLTMISNKTSVLIAAAMQMGAIIANIDYEQAEIIYNFGLNLGLAFQLQDDYLDTFGNAATFGKQIGGDILENKKTYLYLKALQVSNLNDNHSLVELYNSNAKDEAKINSVTQIFERNGVGELTKEAIQKYTKKAFKDLEKLQISDENKNILKEFGLGLMKRTI